MLTERDLLLCSAVSVFSSGKVAVHVARQARGGVVRDDAGFTLLEILVVVGLMGVVAAMAIMVSPSFTRSARADAGLVQLLDAIRSAREVAISQRRNVEIRFVGLNALQTWRREIGANGVVTGTTLLRTVELENRLQFRLDPAVPDDTPDLFRKPGAGWTGAISFGPKPDRMFTSEGTFVDSDGDPLNGTVFMSIPDQANSLRAITVMGATALIHVWRWNGRDWVE
jgi:prepilin-type N-terminal cleavage/methylation domain-containing protein